MIVLYHENVLLLSNLLNIAILERLFMIQPKNKMIIERVSLFFQARTDFKAKFERFWKRYFEEIWTRRHGTRGN
jgi:hypothetical protein